MHQHLCCWSREVAKTGDAQRATQFWDMMDCKRGTVEGMGGQHQPHPYDQASNPNPKAQRSCCVEAHPTGQCKTQPKNQTNAQTFAPQPQH
mmetsp:Transcript_90837/g.157563  ORF Transcript_90837/g.157563 Transcript_90837/m.157563 type:complete len:91 (-) Transcript_90837:342-614(-)